TAVAVGGGGGRIGGGAPGNRVRGGSGGQGRGRSGDRTNTVGGDARGALCARSCNRSEVHRAIDVEGEPVRRPVHGSGRGTDWPGVGRVADIHGRDRRWEGVHQVHI